MANPPSKINTYNKNSRKDRFTAFSPTTIQSILDTDQIKKTYKLDAIFHFVLNDVIDLENLKKHIENLKDDQNSEFRKLLYLYNFKKYA